MTATKEPPNQRPNQPQQDEVWAFSHHLPLERVEPGRLFGPDSSDEVSSRFCSEGSC